VAATNCLNFGNPEKPPIMWQFSQVIDGLTRACEELECPITGGNVSFYNETLGEGIYPTPVVGVVGILEDVNLAMRPHFRAPGRRIVLLRASEPGDLADAEAEFGSSEYAKSVLGAVWGFPPALELEKEAELQKCIVELVRRGLIESSHDCSEGGLGVTLAESGFVHRVGARIQLNGRELPPEFLVFGEDASRILVSCVAEKLQEVEQIGLQYGVAVDVIGETIPDNLEIAVDGKAVVFAPLSRLYEAWGSGLERTLHLETEERLVPAALQKS
jgi:phosphoribosylformylglycinamidine synthase